MSDSDDDIPLIARSAKILPAGSHHNPHHPVPVQVKEETPDPQYARTSKMIIDDDSDDSEDDMPLSQRNQPVKKINGSNISSGDSSSSDDDVPLSQKHKTQSLSKNGLKAKPKVKIEPMNVDSKSKSSAKRSTPSVKNGDAKRQKAENSVKVVTKKAKKEETDEDVYRWWEENQGQEDDSDGTIKWTTLQHSGVLFPPDYVPHGIKMKYDGVPITLSPEAEEVASFFAALLETDYGKNPTFQKNFFEDWQEILRKDPRNPKISHFEKCDFRSIWEMFEKEKEKKKNMTKEEKVKIKEAKTKQEEPFLFAIVDDRKEKVGNFRIEPPGLFRGRGDHPKTGKLKQRVLPEQVTLNLSENARVPAPPPGHKWGGIVHEQTATWLATWKENVNGTFKYVSLAATSTWKGQSDMQKFDKARELKKHVNRIRKNYMAELKDKSMETCQRATAMYLIDRLALRAGNEKGDDEADTVGCCSLRYEHIELQAPNILHFDFLGKDSIRYQNSIPVNTQVFKNIALFKKQVGPGKMIFDRLTTGGLNKHLKSCMKGLSAKVFRTYNASHTFQQQLDIMTVMGDSIPDKVLSFNRANREVAVLCNHQRSASKSHEQQMSKIMDKIRAHKYQRMKFRKQIFYLEPSMKKKRPDLAEDESDLDDEWIAAYEVDLCAKEREKTKLRFEKQNEKLKSEKKPLLPASDLKEKLKAIDERETVLKKERKTGIVVAKDSMTVEKLLANIEKVDQRLNATKIQATDKEENKEIALGTSKINYIDPRIPIAWCKKHTVPLEKVYSKTMLDKFRWAQNTPASWTF